jgi:hypothetical protein
LRGDQNALHDRYDAVVLLSAPVDVLLERGAHRANRFGSTSEDRAKIASDLAAYEPLLRAGADHEIVTTAPVAEVVSALEPGCAHRSRSEPVAVAAVRPLRDRHRAEQVSDYSGSARAAGRGPVLLRRADQTGDDGHAS